MNTTTKKIIVVSSILLLFFQIFMPNLMAAEIGEDYYLQRADKAFYSVQKLMDNGKWVYITYEVVYYLDKDGNKQIAYCINPDLPGVGWAQGSIEGYKVKLTEAMSNVKIWRVCINGYPYKNHVQLGVETHEDAYLATKQAINCILRGYTPEQVYQYYRAGTVAIDGQDLGEIQRRGSKVVDAIYNLVKIAYTSNQTPANSENINVNKINNLKKDDIKEGYYSQEYLVKSSINMESYTIIKINNFPEGTIITDSKGNIKSTFSKNEKFKVLIPKEKLNKNIDGTIELKAKSENYPIFFGLSELEGYQDYAVCCEPYGDIPKVVNFNVNANTGKIKINKVDADTNIPIENVKFQLSKDGKIISTAETNSEGIAYFSDLYQGKYIVKEISTNSSYILDEKEITVDVGFNETVQLKATNTKKKGKIKVIKVDKDNKSIKVPDVTFEVLDENQKIVDIIKTNKSGEAITKDLPIDSVYKVREKETREEYVLSNEIKTVTLQQDELKTIQFENEKKKGQIKIIKVDKDYSEIKIPNVEFNIYNSKQEIVDRIVTNKNGEAVTKKLPIDDTYVIKETKVDRKYLLNNEEIKITLKQDEIKEKIITNEHKKGDLTVYKVDKDNRKKTLGGIEFELFSEEFNKVIGKYTTDANGEINFLNLRIGNYKLIETKTNKWYKLAENTQVEIKQGEKNNTYIENELKKGQIRITKIDKDNHEVKIEGVEFTILDEAGNIVDKVVTDKNGEAISKKLSINQSYEIKETKAHEKYVINKESKVVQLEEDKIKEITFENEKIKGYLNIIKTSADKNEYLNTEEGNPLSGAVFEIQNEDGKVVCTVETNEQGRLDKDLMLEKGKYTIKEVKSPDYYILNEEKYEFEIKENNQKIELRFTNKSLEKQIKKLPKTGY